MSLQLLAFFSCLFAVKASLITPYRNIHNEYVDPANSLESCDLSSCDAYCRRAGYPLGVCLENTCFCIQPHEMTAANTEQGALDKSSSLESCDASTCNSQCKQHGYPFGGICLNGGCYCIKAEGDSFELLTLPGALNKSSTLKSCDASTCNSQCKQHGYRFGGICFNGGCYCIKAEGDSFELLTLSVSKPKTCRHRSCSLKCQIAGFRRGVCWFGICFCFPNEIAYNKLQEEFDSSNSLETCFDTSCDSTCRSHGYPRGVCIYNKCYCVRPSETVRALQNIQEEFDSSNSLETCFDTSCDSTCRSHGYPRGVCIYNKCYCVRPSETVRALQNMQELTDSSKNKELNANMLDDNCQDEKCDQLCNMSGVNGGVCVHGQCTCSLVKGRNLIGMLSPQSCNIFTCMRSCVALNYTTGMCESTRGCRCY